MKVMRPVANVDPIGTPSANRVTVLPGSVGATENSNSFHQMLLLRLTTLSESDEPVSVIRSGGPPIATVKVPRVAAGVALPATSLTWFASSETVYVPLSATSHE